MTFCSAPLDLHTAVNSTHIKREAFLAVLMSILCLLIRLKIQYNKYYKVFSVANWLLFSIKYRMNWSWFLTDEAPMWLFDRLEIAINSNDIISLPSETEETWSIDQSNWSMWLQHKNPCILFVKDLDIPYGPIAYRENGCKPWQFLHLQTHLILFFILRLLSTLKDIKSYSYTNHKASKPNRIVEVPIQSYF